ncbi:ABC-2 family transporter protein [Streptomyces sp. NPDC000927]|uniref:ABC-2 family transporter protein n=1 Tax=Streptomyces sp. NPDC000927 TaxID=3154371 RepID=UPI0033318486
MRRPTYSSRPRSAPPSGCQATAGYLAAAVVGGALTEAAVVTAVSSAALHYPAASPWTGWLQELIGTFGIYPLNILPRTARHLFTYLLPLAFVACLPATAPRDRRPAPGIPGWLVTVSPLMGLALYAASRRLWKLGRVRTAAHTPTLPRRLERWNRSRARRSRAATGACRSPSPRCSSTN